MLPVDGNDLSIGVTMLNAESFSAKLSVPIGRNRIISAGGAVAVIRAGDPLAACGITGTGFPENISKNGLEFIKNEPGVDLDRDILARMDFTPALSRDLEWMNAAIFSPEPMGRPGMLPRA
jgi:hypothetical protein